MAKQRIGRGPLDVALQDTAAPHPRLYVRDGNGLLVVLPVPPASLPAVRGHLARSRPGPECEVELVDERGQVASRWGVFTDPGAAAALAAVLLGTDRDVVDARVVTRAGEPAGVR